MKKADIITIVIVLLISIGFYIYYTSTHRIMGDVEVRILYQGEVVYQIKWEEDEDLIIGIGPEEYWTEAHKTEHNIDEVITVAEDIINIVRISGDEISMIEANCKNKDCYGMKITRKVSTAIVCTNGIVVRLSISNYGETIIGGIIWSK